MNVIKSLYNSLLDVFTEKKSDIRDYDFADQDSVNFLLGISDGQPFNVQPRTAYYLNEKNSDLGTATDKISKAIAALKKGLRDNQGEINFEHPFLSAIRNPGLGVSGSQFWRELSESYLLTQEGWIVGRGNINRPPLALEFIRPYDVTVVMDFNDGLPQVIMTQSYKDRKTYYRFQQGSNIRFVDRSNLNEIFPLRGALSIVDDWRGRSPLVKLFYDISMNTDGKRHNVSLLKNGMRTTAVLSPQAQTREGTVQKWTDATVKAIQDRIRSFNQGAGNAGNMLILGSPAKVDGLTQSNKDMDFLALLKNSQVSIYNLFEIPLALVLPDTMTLDNYTVANRTYYTKAVFPVYESLGDTLIDTLGKRYGLDSEEVSMGFSEVAIRDLQPVLVENMAMLKATEAVEVNEIRKVGGLEDVEGGNVILVSSNKIPLDSVSEPLEFPEVDEEDDQEDVQENIEDESEIDGIESTTEE